MTVVHLLTYQMAPLTWLVTGCTSGFGEQFVQSILTRGDKVIASGRKASSRLEHLKAAGAYLLDLDVTASQAELNQKVSEALAAYGKIDILVNNAGYVESGFVEELTYGFSSFDTLTTKSKVV